MVDVAKASRGNVASLVNRVPRGKAERLAKVDPVPKAEDPAETVLAAKVIASVVENGADPAVRAENVVLVEIAVADRAVENVEEIAENAVVRAVVPVGGHSISRWTSSSKS